MGSYRRCMVATVLFVLIPGLSAVRADEKKPQRVSFKTADGVTIVADYYAPVPQAGQKAPIAILLHMYPADRSSWRDFAMNLSSVGFAVLAIDMRGQGESIEPADMQLADRYKKRDPTLFRSMHEDVAAAYHWLTRQPDVDRTRFALVGASVGCSVAMDYARQDASVDVVVCLSPGANYMGINSLAHIRKYGDRPLLLAASEKERDAPEALAKSVPRAVVKIYPMGGRDTFGMHGTNLLAHVPELAKLATDTIREGVGNPAASPVVATFRGKVYYAPDNPYVQQIKSEDLRYFSSAAEAEARGLRAASRP
ncbi:MAG TPA: alpha/beta fold hydrolase [Phycisphaerae bacterium]|nr:alpha/beta fold hydrolase [Phycisphaerae bacterium]